MSLIILFLCSDHSINWKYHQLSEVDSEAVKKRLLECEKMNKDDKQSVVIKNKVSGENFAGLGKENMLCNYVIDEFLLRIKEAMCIKEAIEENKMLYLPAGCLT
jgi:hypothetical protein